MTIRSFWKSDRPEFTCLPKLQITEQQASILIIITILNDSNYNSFAQYMVSFPPVPSQHISNEKKSRDMVQEWQSNAHLYKYI